MKIKYGLKRIVEKAVYASVNAIYNPKMEKYFRIEVKNKERIPEGSAVLAFNHTLGLDGLFTCFGLYPRQVHHLIQFEGVCDRGLGGKVGLWAGGFIPVSVGTLDENGNLKENSVNDQMNSRAIRRAKDYLVSYDDFVGIFVDGPAARLINSDGKPLEKDKRQTSESAALISLTSGRPVIPVGTYASEEITKRLWEFGFDQAEKNMWYLKNRKQKLEYQGEDPLINYEIRIGKPIFPTEIEGKGSERRRILTEMIKKEIVRLSQK